MRFTIWKEDTFDAAHYLPNVPDEHKCRNIHGHTYRIRIYVTGPIGADTGWVMDYADLKAAWAPLKAQLDHQYLNNMFLNPTCEEIAKWIWNWIDIPEPHTLERVELNETGSAGVVITEGTS